MWLLGVAVGIERQHEEILGVTELFLFDCGGVYMTVLLLPTE